MNELRKAILKAATSIENNPKLFDFYTYDVVKPECGTAGCALGWVAFHQKIKLKKDPTQSSRGSRFIRTQTRQVIGCGEEEFYNRMDRIEPQIEWRNKASICARTLRGYANKFHPCSRT